MANPYGRAHRRTRTNWQAEIDRTGSHRCHCPGTCGHHAGRCTTLIRPGQPWHLGHQHPVVHGGADGPKAPWCEHCNTADGNRIRRRREQAVRFSTDWDPAGDG